MNSLLPTAQHGQYTDGTHHVAVTTTVNGFMSATDKVKLNAISGTNTGDQTITLTGGVTGSGAGSFVATVVTNANLTGPISSIGNATSITSQTGTGTKFVMDTSPTLITPIFSGLASGSISGNAATVTTNANLTGDVTSTGNATSISSATVTGKLLTGFVSGAGTLAAADSVLSGLNKLDGNIALKAALASPSFTGTPIAPTAAVDTSTTQISTTAFVINQGYAKLLSPSFTTPTLGVASATSLNKVVVTAPTTTATLTIANNTTLTTTANATISGTNTGDITIGTANGLSLAGQALSLATVTTSVNGAMLATDKVKLDGVATGATANNTDAFLLSRTNHTGTQLAATISDFSSTVLATALTGLSTATSATITATDTVLSGMGKLQAQVTTAAFPKRFRVATAPSFNTTSLTYVSVTGSAITPTVAGTYWVEYYLTVSYTTTSQQVNASVFKNTTQQTDSEQYFISAAANRASGLVGHAEVVVNGTTDIIDLYLKTSAGTATVNARIIAATRIA